jgi:integrase
MSLFRRGGVWWYEFWYAGRRVQESTKSTSKTIARTAEQDRRRELEKGFNNFSDTHHERIRTFSEVATEFYDGYKLRLPDSAVFADYAVRHLKRLLGSKMLVDFSEAVVIEYQNARLSEGTAPKTVNEEVGFLLRILGDPGDIIRARLRKKKMLKLKVRKGIGKAYSEEEKQRMLEEARNARSPHIYLALNMALNAGMRDKEIRTLTWAQIHFDKNYLAVGRSKTEAGDGRTIPLNTILLPVLLKYREWYKEKFGAIQPDWYVFPWGKPRPSDPTRPVTTLKTAWNNVRDNAKVQGRFHDNRHTLITELAESGAGDETIMDIAGHVSKQMLRHYSHIRMEAKRKALESIVPKPEMDVSANKQSGYDGGSLQKSLQGLQNGVQSNANSLSAEDKNLDSTGIAEQGCSELPANTQGFEGESLQKSLQSCNSGGHRGTGKGRKSLKIIGSSGRTRTYNPSVNSYGIRRPSCCYRLL